MAPPSASRGVLLLPLMPVQLLGGYGDTFRADAPDL